MNTDWVNHSYNNSNNKNSIKLKYDYSKIIGTSEGKERLIQVFRSSKNTDTLKENLKEFLTEEVPVIKATLPLLQFCKGSINDLYYACLNDFINSILHDIENNLPRNLIKYRELLKLTWRYIQVEPFRKIPLTLAADLPIDKELLFIFNDLTDVKVYESCSVKLKKKVLAHVPELKDKKIQDLIDAYVTDPELLQHSKDVLSNVYIYPQQDVVYIRKNNEKFKEIQAFIGNDIGMYDAFTKKIKSMYKLLSNPLLCSLRLDLTINCNIKINAYTGHDSLFSFTHGLTNVLNNFDIKDVSQLENKLNELSIKNGDGILSDLALILSDRWVLFKLSYHVFDLLYNSRIDNRNHYSKVKFMVNLLETACYVKRIIFSEEYLIHIFPDEEFTTLSLLLGYLRIESNKRGKANNEIFYKIINREEGEVLSNLVNIVCCYGSASLIMSHYCYMLFHSANTFTLGEVLNEVVLPCIKELEKAQEIVQAPPFEEQKVKSRLRSFSTKSLYFDPFNDLIVAMFDTYINSGKIEEHLNKKEILFSTFYTHMHQLSMYNITTHKKFLELTCLCLNSYFLPRSRSNSLDFGDKDLLNRIFMGVKKLAEISINNFTFSSKIIMRPFYTKVNKCFLCFGENLGYNPKGTCLDKMVNE